MQDLLLLEPRRLCTKTLGRPYFFLTPHSLHHSWGHYTREDIQCLETMQRRYSKSYMAWASVQGPGQRDHGEHPSSPLSDDGTRAKLQQHGTVPVDT